MDTPAPQPRPSPPLVFISYARDGAAGQTWAERIQPVAWMERSGIQVPRRWS